MWFFSNEGKKGEGRKQKFRQWRAEQVKLRRWLCVYEGKKGIVKMCEFANEDAKVKVICGYSTTKHERRSAMYEDQFGTKGAS